MKNPVNMNKTKIITKLIRHYREEEDGVVLILVALSMVIIFGFAAFAVDLGIYDYKKSQLQTACDAAALAAMDNLPGDMAAATATALEYIQKNGFSASDVTVTFPTDPNFPDFHNKVRVASARQQKTYFANIFNIQHIDYNCHATAFYDATPAGGAFDYLLFSGSRTIDLVMKTNYTVLGSIHTNSDFDAGQNKNYYVMGAIEAVGEIYNKGGSNCYGKLVEGAEFIDINTPSFTSVIEQVAPKWWQYDAIYDASYVQAIANNGVFTVPSGRNYYIAGSVDFKHGLLCRGKLVVSGDITVSGKIPSYSTNTGIDMPENGLVYAVKRGGDGSGGSIYCNYHYSGKGCLFAEKDLTFVNGYVYVLSTGTVSLYAKTGNINLNFGGTDGYGIIYAPSGQITIGQGNTTWHGNIIANTLNTIPANVTVAVNDRMLPYIVGAKHAVLIE